MRDIVLELERGYEPLLLYIEDDALPLGREARIRISPIWQIPVWRLLLSHAPG